MTYRAISELMPSYKALHVLLLYAAEATLAFGPRRTSRKASQIYINYISLDHLDGTKLDDLTNQ